MIKRSKKVVSLMIAASSMLSMIPAEAAQLIKNSDGEIKNAITYKDGKYLYEGNKGESEYGVYYNNGQTETKVEGIDTLTDYYKHNNFVSVGDSNKIINLETGSISLDDSNKYDKTEAEAKLKAKLKAANKYGDDFEIVSFDAVENNKASDEQWYSYVVKANKNFNDEAVETPEAEYETEIEVKLNYVTCSLKIAGITFEPVWGDELAEKLVEKLNKVRLKDGYNIKNAKVEANADGSKYVVFTLGTNAQLDTVPSGLVVFLDNGQDKDITDLGGSGWMGSASLTKNDNNFGDDVEEENPVNELKKKWNTEMKIKVSSFWGPLTINGVEIQTGSAKNTVDNVNNADLGDEYEAAANLLVDENGNESAVITLGTKEVITNINEIPADLIKFNGNNVDIAEEYGLLHDEGWAVTIGNSDIVNNEVEDDTEEDITVNELKKKWNTEMKIKVSSFWGPLTINGVEIQTGSAKNTVNNVNAADFGDEYEAAANLLVDENGNESAVITLGTKEVITNINEIPVDLIKFNGNNVNIAEEYGLLHDEGWAVTIGNSDIVNNEVEDKTEDDDNQEDSSDEEVKKEMISEFKILITQFGESIRINGVEIQTRNAKQTVDNINAADFGDDYEISAKRMNGNQVIITVKTTEDIKTIEDISEGFLSYGDSNVNIFENYGTLHDEKWAIAINNKNISILLLEDADLGKDLIKKISEEIFNIKDNKLNILQYIKKLSSIIESLKNEIGKSNEVSKDNEIIEGGSNTEVSEGIEAEDKSEVEVSEDTESEDKSEVEVSEDIESEDKSEVEVSEDTESENKSEIEVSEDISLEEGKESNVETTKDKIEKEDSDVETTEDKSVNNDIAEENKDLKEDVVEESINTALLAKDDLRREIEVEVNEASDSDNESAEDEKVLYFGFTDGNGNYVDCTKSANLKVFDGNNVVNLSEFNSVKEVDGKKIKAGLPSLISTLGEDNDYIYCVIEVDVTNYQPGTGDLTFNDDVVSKLKYVQKISKSKKNSTDDGAYLPNSVTSYQICSDSSDWNSYYVDSIIGNKSKNIKTVIINGNIFYAQSYMDGEDTKVKFGKINLKESENISFNNIDGESVNKKYNLAQHNSATETLAHDWTFDSQGNVWAIYDGMIKKSRQATSFIEVYECDETLDNLDVYDDTNLIAWNDETNNYVTFLEGEIAQSQVIRTGWRKLSDGTWHLYDLKGNDTHGWVNYDSCWYYFDENGVMQSNTTINGYYIDKNGVCKK